MLVFPNAKINLGLHIISKRPDGYHNIETIFAPIGWSDVLEVIPSKDVSFTSSGLTIPGNTESNLCIKAYQELKKRYAIPPVAIHLHKIIPMGAGLGGGSSDAAYTLRALNTLFELQLTDATLLEIASGLGSDCAFFIKNRPVFAEAKGEVFTDISLNLKGLHIAVVYPRIHVSTQEAYGNCRPRNQASDLKKAIQMPIDTWQQHLDNDFEKTVFEIHPELASIKQNLLQNGAIYAAMSGSGSAIFGLFKQLPNVTELRNKGYTLYSSQFE